MSQILPPGEKLRRVLQWMAETRTSQPLVGRLALIEQASIQFDLSPAFEEWLIWNLSEGERAQLP
jgi:hypothetical protein